MQNLIRSDTRYLINLGELDEAIAQTIDAENNEDAPQEAPQEAPEAPEAPAPPRRKRNENGKLLAEYILKVLRAFDRATTTDNVVSAFAQIGIHSAMTDSTNVDRRSVYVDATTARLGVEQFGTLPDAVIFR